MASPKLSPALKQLLSINAHPPNLTQSTYFSRKLNHLLSDLHQTAAAQKLTPDSWIIFSTAALVSLNRPSAFEPFWSSLTSSAHRYHQAHCADLIRETGLKAISFIGIAKSINALNAFRTVLEAHPDTLASLSSLPRRLPSHPDNSVQQIYGRASATWTSVYRPLDQKLLAKLAAAHPDLPVHILHSHYGPLLSDPPSDPGPVGRIGTSLVALGTLRAAGQLGPQLLSHVYGLKKAGEELKEIGEASLGEGVTWLTSDAGAEWVIRAIDRLIELLSEAESHSTSPEDSPKL